MEAYHRRQGNLLTTFIYLYEVYITISFFFFIFINKIDIITYAEHVIKFIKIFEFLHVFYL